MRPPQPRSTLFPYTTLFRSLRAGNSSLLARMEGRADFNLREEIGGWPRSFVTVPPAGPSSLPARLPTQPEMDRSEEHTSELQSHSDLVCRLLLEKKKGTEYI